MIIKEQSYRIKRGTKAADLPSQRASSPPPLDNLDGPFRLAEYLAYKVWRDPHDVRRLAELPKGDDGEPSQGKNVWIYEHLRRLPIDLTPLLTSLLPICTKESCPQMKAEEWMYLCVAHGGGAGTEECCAIDYILHTVDSTATLLNSSKSFPSRMSIPNTSLSHFPSLFRRLSRIFSHAYYHHREAFSLAEAETSLYARFVALCETYNLVGSNLLVIPKSAISNLGEPSGHGEEEEEEHSSEDSEDAEDDEESEGARGREGEGNGKERRTQSLDRAPPPMDDWGGRRKELVPKTPAATSGTAPVLQTAKQEDRALDRSKTVKTLGRGKQNRGTMLWSSDESPAPPAIDSVAAASGMERSESLDTVVHISPEPKEEPLPPIEGVSESASETNTAASDDTSPQAVEEPSHPVVETPVPTVPAGGSEGPIASHPDPIVSNAGQTAEGAPIPADTTSPKEAESGEMVDVKLDEHQTASAAEPTPATSEPPLSPPLSLAATSTSTSTSPPAEATAPKSPNPDTSPARSKSAHGVGRLSKPSTPAKSFVASAKSPAAPLLSTGGSGDSPAKTGDTEPSAAASHPPEKGEKTDHAEGEKTKEEKPKSPLGTSTSTMEGEES